MGKLIDHTNCPNPVQWGNSPVKTVYVRDSESGKATWKPVGYICTGCGVFRVKPGYWYGKIEPICEPWKPAKTPIESIREGPDPAHAEDEAPGFETALPTEEEIEQAENAVVEEEKKRESDQFLEGVTDYGGPGKDLPPEKTYVEEAHAAFLQGIDTGSKAKNRPGRKRTRISPERVASLLRISPEEVREKIRIGEIPANKDPWRHWRVDLAWYSNKCQALGTVPG